MPDAQPSDAELLDHARSVGLVGPDVDVLPAKYRTRALASFLDRRAADQEPPAPGEALTVQVVVSLAGEVLGRSTITIPIDIQLEPHHG